MKLINNTNISTVEDHKVEGKFSPDAKRRISKQEGANLDIKG